jgi:hypothetical protein
MLFKSGDEVTGGWKKLHNEELRDLYSSLRIIRVIKSRIRLAWHLARMGEKRNALLVGMQEGKWSLGKTNIDVWIILRKIGDWIDPAQDRNHEALL